MGSPPRPTPDSAPPPAQSTRSGKDWWRGELASTVAWLALSVVGFLAGAVAQWSLFRPDAAAWLWGGTLFVAGVPFVWRTVRQLLRLQFAADVVAALAIVVAFAQQQYAAGVVIMMMLTTGQALEAYGHRRASDALAALLERAPRTAHRHNPAAPAALEDVPVEHVAAGDRLLIRPGELVPVDALVLEGASSVDEAALTGEPLPVAKAAGAEVRSGTVNVDGALEVRALRPAGESEYAQVVRLMETAQQERPAVQRAADRVAIWFTPFTLAVAGLAYLISGDASRVLAVLVVATPCPLILATPVALIAGINRAARHGIVVKHGAAIETLARVTAAVFDKTGTLTYGHPAVERIVALSPEMAEDELIAYAAAVEQRSSHLLARAIMSEAERRGVAVPPARAFIEVVGRGARARVGDHQVAVGSLEYAGAAAGGHAARCDELVGEAAARAQLIAAVAVDGRCDGLIMFADMVRPGLPEFFSRLRSLGVRRAVMLTGDHWGTARAVAAQAGIDDVRAELRPADKTAAVAALRNEERGVLMVGDGINDAPALATATVGVAMGARGAAISAAAADVVLLVDDVGRVADAVAIGQRTMRVVWQCIGFGLGLSGVAMAAAALGFVHPIAGAAVQEAIDLVVVLNALRAR